MGMRGPSPSSPAAENCSSGAQPSPTPGQSQQAAWWGPQQVPAVRPCLTLTVRMRLVKLTQNPCLSGFPASAPGPLKVAAVPDPPHPRQSPGAH